MMAMVIRRYSQICDAFAGFLGHGEMELLSASIIEPLLVVLVVVVQFGHDEDHAP